MLFTALLPQHFAELKDEDSSCCFSLFVYLSDRVPGSYFFCETVYTKAGTTGWERGVHTVQALSTIKQRVVLIQLLALAATA